MRLLLQFAMVFFGTLMAAGLLALGAPQPRTHAQFPIVRHSTFAAGSSVNARARVSPIE